MKPKIRWGRLLRRSAALFLATLAVWALLLVSGGGSAAGALRGLGENPGVRALFAAHAEAAEKLQAEAC